MEFWRYLRDIMVVVGVLLLVGGIVVSWWAFCLVVYVAGLTTSIIFDYKTAPKLPPKKRPF